MEILFLTHRIPYPPNKGDKVRSYAMIRHLAKHHTVHLACFIDDPHDLRYVDVVRELTGGDCLFIPLKPVTKWLRAGSALLAGQPITTAYFGSTAISRWAREHLASGRIDRVIVFGSAMAPYVLGAAELDPSRVFFDMLDVDSDKWRQYAAQAPAVYRQIYDREAEKLLEIERAAAAAFGVTTLVSPYEAATFRELAPESANRVQSLGNGVDLEPYKPVAADFLNPYPQNQVPIVMTGWMDYRANVDGALWFATKVMPHISPLLPDACFYIVGGNPVRALRNVAGSRTVLTGRVDDVRPYLHHAAVAVAPLRIARGVQNKVLEAMAMRKPVVATPQATRALSVTSGVELWIESEPARFAAAVVAAVLGKDSEQIARNGRSYVEQNHDWQHILATFDEMLAQLERPHEGKRERFKRASLARAGG
jgi:sugar transferase (PEP-CTERM/EpsH1 system associated)